MAVAAGHNQIGSFIFGKPQEFGRDRLLGMKIDLCSDRALVADQVVLNVVDAGLGLCPGAMLGDRRRS